VDVTEAASKDLIKWRSYRREGESICGDDGSREATKFFEWLVVFFPLGYRGQTHMFVEKGTHFVALPTCY
jgi:hypothetical protein